MSERETLLLTERTECVCLCVCSQLKLRPAGNLNVQVRHFREGEGNTSNNNMKLNMLNFLMFRISLIFVCDIHVQVRLCATVTISALVEAELHDAEVPLNITKCTRSRDTSLSPSSSGSQHSVPSVATFSGTSQSQLNFHSFIQIAN